ncbi:hypothetical protein EH243_11940 [Amphritea opalescens]|uniref:Uncharacterized protein n=1 Tax=Amphritea opalescens TaxID=2490544 RepID=A0A430KPI9_9GAMM|nr:hypothetical protein [Amphritea opalescens]RTE65375.1 hypothetical protein EH243_11940 [Amphritea opalescens]
MDLKRGPQRSGNKRHQARKVGEAVCDMQGDLWDLDGIFLHLMKQLVPGWSGGALPSEVMPELKNTGQFHAHDLLLTAEPAGGGKISLRICAFEG